MGGATTRPSRPQVVWAGPANCPATSDSSWGQETGTSLRCHDPQRHGDGRHAALISLDDSEPPSARCRVGVLDRVHPLSRVGDGAAAWLHGVCVPSQRTQRK
jgi:hypothetical protein